VILPPIRDRKGIYWIKKVKMKLKINKKDDIRLEFNIKGINASTANSLRRILISKLPMMAIEEVNFYDNSSILDDEILAHRLGLIPLKTDLKTYNLIAECTCRGKGCAKCTAILTLDVHGPGMAYSSELKSTDPEIVPIYDKIPVVKLTETQCVKLEAKAQLGTGREHIKWQGGLASYEIKKDGSFDFFVESYGQLKIQDMIKKAFDIINDEIKELKSTL